MANGLAGETSPYLLQHKDNPVDWRPWGPAALEAARSEDKPIFLSIGYAACHWCHVMERESFEDESVAAYLNQHFVSIKVDREERPDIDEIYMNAVQLLTGAGGWPLTAFLTPDLRPFAGGTYFPPEDRWGRIGFRSLLERITAVWREDRDRVGHAGDELTGHLERIARAEHGDNDGAPTGPAEIERALAEMKARFDTQHGGFGAAPKFPPDAGLTLLLGAARDGDADAAPIVEHTLDAMARGGMYDHVGGGFARYSVDERWLVPHFEKMLYNQALLVPVYLEASTVFGREDFRVVAERTLDFVRCELTDPAGGFWSSLDADSEGVEGKFYVWDPAEIEAVLGKQDAALFCDAYDITSEGNFEGRSIPNRLHADLGGAECSEPLARLRETLLEAREERVRPATDDKVLTAWNGLMITAFARAHQTTGRDEDLVAATNAAEFALEHLVLDGRLRATWRRGSGALNGYLDDYAFLGRAMLDLYETDFDRRWLDFSADLAGAMLEHFEDPDRGGFFFTSDDHEKLLTRNTSTHDGALPSGSGVAAGWLWRLGGHLDDPRFRSAAQRTLVALRPAVERSASSFSTLLAAADLLQRAPVEIAIVGKLDDPRTRALLERAHARLRPGTTLAVGHDEAVAGLPLFEGRAEIGGDRPAAYVCVDRACGAPVDDPDALDRELDRIQDS